MKLLHGRPNIGANDHPNTVYSALLGSVVFYNKEMPEPDADAWCKTAQDAYEAVQDGFGIIDAYSDPIKPNGEALLYLRLEQLELALVNYGYEQLEKPCSPDSTQEVANVDDLLKSIDSLKS